MKASIVIPSVDRRETLCKAVDSALSQLAPEEGFEVIVVDNSPDGQQHWISEGRASLRYVAEPRTGLSRARNAGIAAAAGEFIVFLDDDEEPENDGWLTALLLAADKADAAFGPVLPSYAHTPEKYAAYVTQLYTRDLRSAAGEEVTARAHLLGSGNSAFRRATCFPGNSEAFKTQYDRTGGEDTELIRRLALSGKKLVWAPAAMVLEFVPAERMTLTALGARRFAQGQMRSAVHLAPESRRPHLTFFWMGMGVAQFVFHQLAAIGARIAGRTETAELHHVQSWGGLGKVLWGTRFRRIRYGARRA
jgi:glycosyltransferase involved in cell wall biosynthesis